MWATTVWYFSPFFFLFCFLLPSPAIFFFSPTFSSFVISQNTPIPFFEWSCGFSLWSKPTYLSCSTCSYVKQEALKKQNCSRGGTNKWRQTLFADSLHAHTNRPRLTVCVRWLYFQEKYHSWKYAHSPLWGATEVLPSCICERLRYYPFPSFLLLPFFLTWPNSFCLLLLSPSTYHLHVFILPFPFLPPSPPPILSRCGPLVLRCWYTCGDTKMLNWSWLHSESWTILTSTTSTTSTATPARQVNTCTP